MLRSFEELRTRSEAAEREAAAHRQSGGGRLGLGHGASDREAPLRAAVGPGAQPGRTTKLTVVPSRRTTHVFILPRDQRRQAEDRIADNGTYVMMEARLLGLRKAEQMRLGRAQVVNPIDPNPNPDPDPNPDPNPDPYLLPAFSRQSHSLLTAPPARRAPPPQAYE